MAVRKGEFFGLSTVVTTIIVIIVGMIVVFIGYKITTMTQELSDVEKCRLSVAAKAKTKGFGGAESLLMKNIECYTRWVSVTEEGIYKRVRGKNSEKKVSFGEDKEKNLYEVKKFIADEMHDCWYQLGEGKIAPWGTLHRDGIAHCVICSQIRFNESFGEIDISNFLLSEKMPRKSLTYAKFLGYSEDDALNADVLDTTKPINIVFIHAPPGAGGIMGMIGHKDLIDIDASLKIEGEDQYIHLGIFYNEDVVEECTRFY